MEYYSDWSRAVFLYRNPWMEIFSVIGFHVILITIGFVLIKILKATGIEAKIMMFLSPRRLAYLFGGGCWGALISFAAIPVIIFMGIFIEIDEEKYEWFFLQATGAGVIIGLLTSIIEPMFDHRSSGEKNFDRQLDSY